MEDINMKKYIQPSIEINRSELLLLAGLSKKEGQGNQNDFFGNTGFFDDMEDSYPPKDKGLWDDQYKKDEN